MAHEQLVARLRHIQRRQTRLLTRVLQQLQQAAIEHAQHGARQLFLLIGRRLAFYQRSHARQAKAAGSGAV